MGSYSLKLCKNIPVADKRIKIGVDTGGTFTDVVLVDRSSITTYKLLSTPDDPGRAVLTGIARVTERWNTANGRETEVSPEVIHGSTVATNALLEGKGSRAAYITTKGFEDVLFIGRQNRPALYDLEPVKPVIPLQADDTIGLTERVLFDGTVRRELAGEELAGLPERLRRLGVGAVAVNLLHSYANPIHEQAVAEYLRRELPDLHITVSHEVLPEFREFERGSTCLVNAVVGPPMARYIGRLADELGPGRLRVMASAGGSLPPDVVAAYPVHTILSGPAGGVVGAFNAAQAGGWDRIISLDMGGTSTDVSLCDGELTRTTESEIAGMPVRLPMIDIHTVGAGGGSVAWVDGGGALRVGPESMGADPGPACYGRQPQPYHATVTDAHAVLGHLPRGATLGDGLQLDIDRAYEAVSLVGGQIGLGTVETAFGILRVVEATMARAVQRISVERGHDLRDFTLVPFGGAGGFHAARLAEQLGIRNVLVPGDPGLLSAIGMVGTAPLYTFSQAVMARLSTAEAAGGGLADLPDVAEALAEVVERANRALADEGIPVGERVLETSLDLRYAGQSYELNIALDGTDPLDRFTRRHERLYGYNPVDKPVEVVAARIRAGGLEHPADSHRTGDRGDLSLADCCEPITITGSAGARDGWRIDRGRLKPGDRLAGPGVVGEYSATTVVPVRWELVVNAIGQLLLEYMGGELSE